MRYDPNLYYIKHNVSLAEYKIHKMVYNMGKFNVPKIHEYDKATKIMVIQKLYGMNISDMFGEDADAVPTNIFDEIRYIIRELYRFQIYYPDITGYNFMVDAVHKNKIWICDFGNAICCDVMPAHMSFIIEFMNGSNQWNPRFVPG